MANIKMAGQTCFKSAKLAQFFKIDKIALQLAVQSLDHSVTVSTVDQRCSVQCVSWGWDDWKVGGIQLK